MTYRGFFIPVGSFYQGLRKDVVMKKVFSVLVVFALFAALFAGVVAQDKVTLTVWESVGGPDEWLIQAGER